jgi:hypothetical protein
MRIFLPYFLVTMVLSVVFMGCFNTSSESKCEVGDPVAIFSDQYSQILNHTFSLTGSNSLETIEFENGIKLELSQSGCEELTQEFRFYIFNQEGTSEKKFWIDFAIQLFNFMGGIDISFADFSFWGEAIKEIRENLKVGVPFELAPGRWIKIDKIESSDHVILLVVLSQQES